MKKVAKRKVAKKKVAKKKVAKKKVAKKKVAKKKVAKKKVAKKKVAKKKVVEMEMNITLLIACDSDVIEVGCDLDEINDVDWRESETAGDDFWNENFEDNTARFYQRMQDLSE